jgi:hypothetical protein
VIQTETGNGNWKQDLTSPCPMCLGLKYAAAETCQIYRTIRETTEIDLPVGCIPGYHIPFEGKGIEVLLHPTPSRSTGNDVLVPGKGVFKTGNLYVDIGKVATGSFEVTDRGLELSVLMTPSEALEVHHPSQAPLVPPHGPSQGFERSYELFPGRSLEINRTNKITFPETEVIVPRQGLPIVNDPNQTQGDLLVIFDFEKVEEEEGAAPDGEEEEEEVIVLDQNILIESQEDFERKFGQGRRRAAAAAERRKDRFLRKVLLNMKREIERERQRRREREEKEGSGGEAAQGREADE